MIISRSYKFEVILTVHRRYYVEINCQLDATDDIYCRFYCMLNMFPTHKYYPRHSHTASTTPDVPYSSICNARHLMPKTQILPNLQITFSVFAAPNTTGSDHLYNTLELLMIGIVLPETCWACNKICNKYHLLHLVGILFPHNISLISS